MKVITIKDTETGKSNKIIFEDHQFDQFLDFLDLIFFKGEKFEQTSQSNEK